VNSKDRLLFKKQSQISIFLILGIVLIILFASYIIYTNTRRDVSDQQGPIIEMETVSDPVYKYVVECLRLTSRDAILEMAEHGGFTDLQRNQIDYDKDEPTNGEAVVMSIDQTTSSSMYAIPYYWHMSSPNGCVNDCAFNLFYPELYKDSGMASIESELDFFINENLERCLNDFDSFTKRGYRISPVHEPRVNTSVNDYTVSFTLDYPVKIEQEDKEYMIKRYYVEQNVDLKPILELALEVTTLQAQYRFLENQVLNLIAGYADIDGPIPPIADSTFIFGDPGKIWVKSQVQDSIEDMLVRYVAALRVNGTNNYVSIGDTAFAQRIFDNQMRIDLNHTYDLDIYFNYLPIWPIYFNMNCEGEICKAESYSTSFIMLGSQRYRFYYTTSYPVLVKIYDAKAFDGDGLNFYFFLESNTNNNNIVWPGDSGNFEGSIGGPSLLCNDNQRNSGNYSFQVIDGLTNELVDGSSLYFICGHETCNLELLSSGKFNGKLPICSGGYMSLQKPGYMSSTKFLATKLDEGENLGEIMLQPFRQVNVTVNKLKFVKPTSGTQTRWVLSGEGPLETGQEATVILTKEQLTGETEHVQAAKLNSVNKTSQMELVPGKYDVNVILMDKSTIIIPEEERETGGLLSQDYTIPEIRFNESAPWLLGGLEGTYEVYNQVDTGNIVINVIAFELGDVPEIDRKLEDIEIMAQVSNYTGWYSSQVGFR